MLKYLFSGSVDTEKQERWNEDMAKKADKMELNSEMLVSLIRKLYAEKKRLSFY